MLTSGVSAMPGPWYTSACRKHVLFASRQISPELSANSNLLRQTWFTEPRPVIPPGLFERLLNIHMAESVTHSRYAVVHHYRPRPPEARRPCVDDIVITIAPFSPRPVHRLDLSALHEACPCGQDVQPAKTPLACVLLRLSSSRSRRSCRLACAFSKPPNGGGDAHDRILYTHRDHAACVRKCSAILKAYAVPCLSYLCWNFISMPISRTPWPQSIRRRPFGLTTHDPGPPRAGLRTASSPRPIHRARFPHLPASP